MIIKLICSNNNTRLILTKLPFKKKIQKKLKPFENQTQRLIFQLTTGMVGFKGATRSSIYGGEMLLKKFIEKLKGLRVHTASFVLLVQGFGPARQLILRKLAQLKILKIKDITPIAHNGCRKPKSLRK